MSMSPVQTTQHYSTGGDETTPGGMARTVKDGGNCLMAITGTDFYTHLASSDTHFNNCFTVHIKFRISNQLSCLTN